MVRETTSAAGGWCGTGIRTRGRAISTRDDYVRPELPSRNGPDDANDDADYRRDDRRDFDVQRRNIQDREHLRILSILYYVFGGLLALGGIGPLFYVFFGFMLLSGSLPGGPGAPPPFLGWLLVVFGGAFSLVFWAVASCCLFAGYNLSQTRRYVFCFVVACFCCMWVPLGTLLGVFTIIVLARPSVKEVFQRASTEEPRPARED